MLSDQAAMDVAALVDGWVDADRLRQPGLLWLVGAQLEALRVDGSVKKKITGGDAPWDDTAASLWLAVHAGARGLEQRLLVGLYGVKRPRRPPSDRHTVSALRRLPVLVAAASEVDSPYRRADADDAARSVADWRRECELLLGVCRRWAHIRRWGEPYPVEVDTAEGPVRVWRREEITEVCPYCGTPLRVRPDLAWEGDPDRHLPHRRMVLDANPDALVVCPSIECFDEQGARHAWPIRSFTGRLLESGAGALGA